MILIEKVLGHTSQLSIGGRTADVLDIDWFDAGKSTIRKTTRSGTEVAIRKDTATPLSEGDILYMDDTTAIVIAILPCDCIVFKPADMREMGTICFEIGNKHMPLFLTDELEVIVAYEDPLFKLLERSGYAPRKETRRLLRTHALKVHGHGAEEVN